MSGHVTLTGGNGLLAPAAAAVGLPSVFHMLHAIHISITGSRLKSTMLLKLCSIIYYGLRLLWLRPGNRHRASRGSICHRRARRAVEAWFQRLLQTLEGCATAADAVQFFNWMTMAGEARQRGWLDWQRQICKQYWPEQVVLATVV